MQRTRHFLLGHTKRRHPSLWSLNNQYLIYRSKQWCADWMGVWRIKSLFTLLTIKKYRFDRREIWNKLSGRYFDDEQQHSSSCRIQRPILKLILFPESCSISSHTLTCTNILQTNWDLLANFPHDAYGRINSNELKSYAHRFHQIDRLHCRVTYIPAKTFALRNVLWKELLLLENVDVRMYEHHFVWWN